MVLIKSDKEEYAVNPDYDKAYTTSDGVVYYAGKELQRTAGREAVTAIKTNTDLLVMPNFKTKYTAMLRTDKTLTAIWIYAILKSQEEGVTVDITDTVACLDIIAEADMEVVEEVEIVEEVEVDEVDELEEELYELGTLDDEEEKALFVDDDGDDFELEIEPEVIASAAPNPMFTPDADPVAITPVPEPEPEPEPEPAPVYEEELPEEMEVGEVEWETPQSVPSNSIYEKPEILHEYSEDLPLAIREAVAKLLINGVNYTVEHKDGSYIIKVK